VIKRNERDDYKPFDFLEKGVHSPFAFRFSCSRGRWRQLNKSGLKARASIEEVKTTYSQFCTVGCRHRRNICSLGLCPDETRTSFPPANALALKRIQKFGISLSSTCLFFPLLCICCLLFLFPTSFSQRPRSEL